MLKINEYFYRLKGKDSFVQKNHSHNEIEFIQVINGDGTVLKNDKTYLLQSRHIYVIDARNAHIVYPQPDDCSSYIRNKIVINADSFERFYRDLGMEAVIETLFESSPISTAQIPEIDGIFKRVSELCGSKTPENIGFAHAYVTELIHLIYLNAQTGVYDEKKNTVQKMLDVINQKQGLTSLAEISEALHMDKYYLCRTFKEKTGTNLSVYLSDKVFEKCCKLLQSTSYSLEQVSALCGFSSSASLTRFFKSKCGITPSAYRKERATTVRLYF